MRSNPIAGEIWRHFKNKNYKIVACPVVHSEDGELYVCYQAQYGSQEIYIRPLSMFMSKTDKEKYPEATQEYRFECVEEREMKEPIKVKKESYDWRNGKLIYIIDEDNRTVTCIFNPIDGKYDWQVNKFAGRVSEQNYDVDFLGFNGIPKCVGVAKCAPEDEFNYKIGKRVAFLKMMRVYNSAIMSNYTRVISKLDRFKKEVVQLMKENTEYMGNLASKTYEVYPK